jgi:hypothetical protein
MDGQILTLDDFTTDLLDDEPRIADWRLAEVLAFGRETNIHNLIERHRPSLERFGTLLHGKAKSTGGRPGVEYRLNFNQTIFVAIKSDAPNAVAVQIHVVTIYGLWAQGKLKPLDAETEAVVRIATAELNDKAPELLAALSELLSRVDELSTRADAADIGARVESVQRTALNIQDRLGDIVKRRVAPVRNQDVYDQVLDAFYLGRCPCCQRSDRIILVGSKRTHLYCLDHVTDNPYKNGLHEMWPVCGICNGKFKHDPRYRAETMNAFHVFQSRVEEIKGGQLI